MTVYADNAATTRMSRTALDAMLPAMEENYGNPSSLHHVGRLPQKPCCRHGRTLPAVWLYGERNLFHLRRQ